MTVQCPDCGGELSGWHTSAICLIRRHEKLKSDLAQCELENTAFERINREVGDMHKLAKTENDALRAELERVKKAKDLAYSERNQVVAMAGRMAEALGWGVGTAQHPKADASWDSDWRTILFMALPTGQVSWHFHDSEEHLLRGFEEFTKPWDGHDTAEKYRRVNTARFDAISASGEEG